MGRSMVAPTPVFIAQQYSSETLFSLRFHSHKKKIRRAIEKVTISNLQLLKPGNACTRLHWRL
jgi:hypothetical protein